MTPTFYSTVTRISDLETEPFEVAPVERSRWATGDYVLAEVVSAEGPLAHVELASGRLAEVASGDRVVGALGRRHATLEVVGDWRRVGDDGRIEALTSAGLFGHATSVSVMLPPLLELRYSGHVVRGGDKVTMGRFALGEAATTFAVPTLLIVGTSMSAGKTTAAKAILRCLAAAGRRAVGTKLTGAGRYKDILAMRDAGAVAVFDFIDVGLPSTVCPAEVYRPALRRLLTHVAAVVPEVLVAEAGASPFEPYNGDVVLDELASNLRAIILCASDPYSVVGVMRGFGVVPDLVCGPTANTTAGCELVERLTGVPASNLLEPSALAELPARIERWLATPWPLATRVRPTADDCEELP